MMDLIYHQMAHIEKNYLLHYHVGDILESTEKRMIGLPMAMLSVFVTASIGVSIAAPDQLPKWAIYLSGGLSLLVSILATLITFLSLKDKAALHNRAAENYYYLLSQCKSFVADPDIFSISNDDLKKRQEYFREEVRRLHMDSPAIPGWAYKKAEKLFSTYMNVSKQVIDNQRKWLSNWLSGRNANKSIQPTSASLRSADSADG